MHTFATQSGNKPGSTLGEMAEWSNAAVLKTVILQGIGGSNPSLSATKSANLNKVALFLCHEITKKRIKMNSLLVDDFKQKFLSV